MSGEVKKIVLYTAMLSDQASAWIRIIAPIRQVGWQLSYGKNSDSPGAELEGAHLVIIQREFPGVCMNWRNVVNAANKLKVPVIFDIDDLLIDMPVEHIDFPYSQTLRPAILDAMRLSDVITVSTGALADQVTDIGKHVRVVPNLLDDSIWQQNRRQQFSDGTREHLVIGYAATSTHRADLDMIGECLARIARQYGCRVHFAFWGIAPPPHLRGMPNVKWQPLDKPRYPEFADFMQNQKFDIAIAPLKVNAFNECKSAIKYLEYAWMKVPAIYSKVTPYESIIQDGSNGLLAGSCDEWYSALSSLVENADLRQRISETAHRMNVENHLLSKEASGIASVWTELMSCRTQ